MPLAEISYLYPISHSSSDGHALHIATRETVERSFWHILLLRIEEGRDSQTF